MSFTETTLVVRGAVDATAANAFATDVANAASSGELLMQINGSAVAADNSAAGANDLIKLSVAHSQPDGSTAVVSSQEFKVGEIVSSQYKAPSTGSNQTITVGNIVAAMNSIRLEAKNGVEVYDVLGVTGKDAAEIVANFSGRADTERFKNVTMAVNGSDVAITVTPRGSDIVVTGDDALTVTVSGDNNGRVGQQDQILDLEKRSFISAGAYNQYEFPIVVPASATKDGSDYAIMTLEIRKDLPGRRKATEIVRIVLENDEDTTNNFTDALSTILGLTTFDLTAPIAFTSVFLSDAGGTTQNTYVIADSDEIHVAVNGAFGADATFGTLVLSSDGSEADVTVNIPTDAANARIVDTGVDATAYADGVTLTATVTKTDAAGNVSTAATDTAAVSAT